MNSLKKLDHMSLIELDTSETPSINGGDGITEAVFKAIGYWMVEYSEDQARNHHHAGKAGFM